MTIHFGGDGWRAVIAEEFTFSAVRRVSGAIATALIEEYPNVHHRVVVGFDRRFLSDSFATAICNVLAKYGIDCVRIGVPVPAGAVSFAVRDVDASAGIIVTASHSPYYFSGIKLRNSNGGAFTRSFLSRVEDLSDHGAPEENRDQRSGTIQSIDSMERYIEYLRKRFPVNRLRDAGLTVAADSMFGVSAGILPQLIDGDASRCVEISTVHNPLFPGFVAPDPVETNLHRLQKIVLDGSAHVGFAFDGDADRMAVVDDRGVYVPQNYLFALLAYYVLEVRRSSSPIVKSVSGSSLVNALALHHDVDIIESGCSFGNLTGALVDNGASMAGSDSGGFAFRFNGPESDAIVSALALIDLIASTGMSISRLMSEIREIAGDRWYRRLNMPLSPGVLHTWRERWEQDNWPDNVIDIPVADVITVDGIRFDLEDGSWLLLRQSGTESALRVYAEVTSEDKLEPLLEYGRRLLMS